MERAVNVQEGMVDKIVYGITLLFLAGLSAEDIRTRELSVYKIISFIGSGLLFRLITGQFTWHGTCVCLLPGIFLLLLSFFTKESIGYGDGMAVTALGLWTGGWFTALAVWIGITLSGIWGGICLLRGKRKETIPFLPFLLLGMEVTLIYA